MKKVVGKRKLTFDKLQVIIFEKENILNNWPLCYIYDDIDDVIIKPNSLLFGRNLESSNWTSADTHIGIQFTSVELPRKHRHLEIVINEFWDVWRRDYLLELWQRIKKSKGVFPKLNDIVIIDDKKLPQQLWKLGQIVELYKSNDSKVRGAKIKFGKTGTLIDRPLNKLYPHEVNSDSNEGRNTVNSSLDENYKSDLQIDEKMNVNVQP